jgi:S1-C subfamily serine protease
VRYRDATVKATLWTWQEDKDLALMVVAKGKVPTISFAARGSVKTGERIFAASALGAAGGAATQGFVADVSSSGIQHDAAVGQAFQGGPLLNNDGKVVGIASRAFAPLGFSSDSVFWAPAIRQACDKVLKCPNDNPNAPGDRR